MVIFQCSKKTYNNVYTTLHMLYINMHENIFLTTLLTKLTVLHSKRNL